MTQVYLIQGSDNDYHQNTWIVGCFLSEQRANEFCEKLNKAIRYIDEVSTNYYNQQNDNRIARKEEKLWIEENFNPPEELKEVIPYILKDITDLVVVDCQSDYNVIQAPLLKHVLA